MFVGKTHFMNKNLTFFCHYLQMTGNSIRLVETTHPRFALFFSQKLFHKFCQLHATGPYNWKQFFS